MQYYTFDGIIDGIVFGFLFSLIPSFITYVILKLPSKITNPYLRSAFYNISVWAVVFIVFYISGTFSGEEGGFISMKAYGFAIIGVIINSLFVAGLYKASFHERGSYHGALVEGELRKKETKQLKIGLLFVFVIVLLVVLWTWYFLESTKIPEIP
jgi:hypothetical protein